MESSEELRGVPTALHLPVKCRFLVSLSYQGAKPCDYGAELVYELEILLD
jgi:hypothetical protein